MILNDIRELCFEDLINKSRALCIDYGDKRVGLAISDITWIIASPLKILNSHGLFKDLFEIIIEYNVSLIVIGAPKSLNGGNSGKQYEKIKKFVNKLIELLNQKNLNINILYWDERLSTVAANKILLESGLSNSSKKNKLDKVAASFILQGVLDFRNFNN